VAFVLLGYRLQAGVGSSEVLHVPGPKQPGGDEDEVQESLMPHFVTPVRTERGILPSSSSPPPCC